MSPYPKVLCSPNLNNKGTDNVINVRSRDVFYLYFIQLFFFFRFIQSPGDVKRFSYPINKYSYFTEIQ